MCKMQFFFQELFFAPVKDILHVLKHNKGLCPVVGPASPPPPPPFSSLSTLFLSRLYYLSNNGIHEANDSIKQSTRMKSNIVISMSGKVNPL